MCLSRVGWDFYQLGSVFNTNWVYFLHKMSYLMKNTISNNFIKTYITSVNVLHWYLAFDYFTLLLTCPKFNSLQFIHADAAFVTNNILRSGSDHILKGISSSEINISHGSWLKVSFLFYTALLFLFLFTLGSKRDYKATNYCIVLPWHVCMHVCERPSWFFSCLLQASASQRFLHLGPETSSALLSSVYRHDSMPSLALILMLIQSTVSLRDQHFLEYK